MSYQISLNMKKILLLSTIYTFLQFGLFAQYPNKNDVFTRASNAFNKANTVLAVFQPYLLKARQLYYDAGQLASDVKQSSAALLHNKNTGNPNGNSVYSGNTYSSNNSGYDSSTYHNEDSSSYNQNNNTLGNYGNQVQSNNSYNTPTGNTNPSPQNYLPSQNLQVNNPATINSDGTGNWGNQNNGLYGNCLDVLTGTIMGLGEAEADPKSVDVIFVAANGSYQLWTPDYARNEVAAQYTSRSTYESVSKWSDVNETEIAITPLTSGQFDKIQNNSQILNAVKNAPNYASSLTEFGKLDGKVFAVKAELEDRTVYGLIEIVKQYGTEGSNGYLKIQIKAQGIDNNQNGQVKANAYLR